MISVRRSELAYNDESSPRTKAEQSGKKLAVAGTVLEAWAAEHGELGLGRGVEWVVHEGSGTPKAWPTLLRLAVRYRLPALVLDRVRGLHAERSRMLALGTGS